MVLLQRLAKETAYDVEFKWLEQGDIEMWDTVTSDVEESDGVHPTEIPVSNPNIFSPDDIVEIPSTGELVLVEEVTNEATIRALQLPVDGLILHLQTLMRTQPFTELAMHS